MKEVEVDGGFLNWFGSVIVKISCFVVGRLGIKKKRFIQIHIYIHEGNREKKKRVKSYKKLIQIYRYMKRGLCYVTERQKKW